MDRYAKGIFVIGCVVVLLLGFFNKCNKGNNEITETTRKVDTIYIASKDSEHDITPEETKPPVYVTNNYTYEASKGNIDTGAILRDYFAKRGYMDTIRNDSIDIILHEEVYKNKLKRSKVAYKWKAPERLIRETITNRIYPNSLFIGGSIGYMNKIPTLGIYGTYETKKAGFGIMIDPFQKGFYLMMSKRIKFQGKLTKA
jgi:hypothetical protein